VRLPPDLLELFTYLTLGLTLGVDVHVDESDWDAVHAGLGAELGCLEEIGVPGARRTVGAPMRLPPDPRPLDIEVASEGCIYSDSQPFFALLLLRARGTSHITDLVWANRFGYAAELRKLGADLEVLGRGRLAIRPSRLGPTDQPLVAGDLRSAAMLSLAALQVGRPVRVEGIQHLLRGYTDFAQALASLGARFEIEPTGSA
jgi:UDP-N-acetylglucosamine 1-carboxyvinyltransferase